MQKLKSDTKPMTQTSSTYDATLRTQPYNLKMEAKTMLKPIRTITVQMSYKALFPQSNKTKADTNILKIILKTHPYNNNLVL